jgi:HSP20 family protein
VSALNPARPEAATLCIATVPSKWLARKSSRAVVAARRPPARTGTRTIMNTTRLPSLFTREPFLLDDAFRSFMRPFRWEAEEETPQMRMDVSETDTGYVVKAEIPGVRKEDIHVEVEGPRIMITAEVKKDKEEKKEGRVIRSERMYGYASRSFTLGHELDRAKAEAKYADGVLTLTLPKLVSAHVEPLKVE